VPAGRPPPGLVGWYHGGYSRLPFRWVSKSVVPKRKGDDAETVKKGR
jgi:hypothetical protein